MTTSSPFKLGMVSTNGAKDCLSLRYKMDENRGKTFQDLIWLTSEMHLSVSNLWRINPSADCAVVRTLCGWMSFFRSSVQIKFWWLVIQDDKWHLHSIEKIRNEPGQLPSNLGYYLLTVVRIRTCYGDDIWQSSLLSPNKMITIAFFLSSPTKKDGKEKGLWNSIFGAPSSEIVDVRVQYGNIMPKPYFLA